MTKAIAVRHPDPTNPTADVAAPSYFSVRSTDPSSSSSSGEHTTLANLVDELSVVKVAADTLIHTYIHIHTRCMHTYTFVLFTVTLLWQKPS